MKHGDFTGLAENYNKFRPGYSIGVLDAIIGLMNKNPFEADFVDVGAGTGIWTRLAAQKNFKSITAVEPNDDMREKGENHPENQDIIWKKGTGERTELPANSADLLTMASSFHWVDFKTGIHEFTRVLRKNGVFVALWNPRLARETPILRKIDDYLQKLKPDMKRVSSGSAEFTNSLTTNLQESELFSEVVYMEGRHSFWMDTEHYLGAWRSVNDVQVQLGPEKFQQFLDFIAKELESPGGLEAIYLTRAWCARKK